MWDGSEKTHGMGQMLNFLSSEIGLSYVEGDELQCQGEDFGDIYLLKVVEGKVTRIDITPGESIVCPHCEERFSIEEAKGD